MPWVSKQPPHTKCRLCSRVGMWKTPEQCYKCGSALYKQSRNTQLRKLSYWRRKNRLIGYAQCTTDCAIYACKGD